jgi:hypothetical protein
MLHGREILTVGQACGLGCWDGGRQLQVPEKFGGFWELGTGVPAALGRWSGQGCEVFWKGCGLGCWDGGRQLQVPEKFGGFWELGTGPRAALKRP